MISPTGVGDAANYVVAYCNTLPTGTSVFNRIGQQMYMTSVTYNFVFTFNPSETGETNIIRAMLIYDKAWNNSVTAPDLEKYLEWASSTYHYLTPVSVYSWENRKRYRILKDKIIMLNTTDQLQKRMSGTVKINRKTMYTGTQSNISDIQSGMLFWVFFSDSTITPHPSMYGNFRLKFKDL